MGVMLIAGFAALIVAIAARVSHRHSGAAADHAFATAPVTIPHGARIEAMTATPDRLILDLVLPDGDRQLVVIDLSTGARLGSIELRAQQ
jgi:hypothetical protein